MSDSKMAEQAQERRKPGRPRCPIVEAAIKKSTLQLVKELGFFNVTMEAIAGRAGVGKATIYRWWPTKAAVTIDAFLQVQGELDEFSDTGNVREDMRIHLESLAKQFASKEGRLIAHLISAAQSDRSLADAFQKRWVEIRNNAAAAVLQRAIDRGEIPPNCDKELVISALYGPIYLKMMLGSEPFDPKRVEDLVHLVFDGVGRTAPKGAKAGSLA